MEAMIQSWALYDFDGWVDKIHVKADRDDHNQEKPVRIDGVNIGSGCA